MVLSSSFFHPGPMVLSIAGSVTTGAGFPARYSSGCIICWVDIGGLVKTPGRLLQPAPFKTAAEKVNPSRYGKIRASFRKGGALASVGVLSISPSNIVG